MCNSMNPTVIIQSVIKCIEIPYLNFVFIGLTSYFSDLLMLDHNQFYLFTAKKVHKQFLGRTLHHIMRPNLILYLDAPVDVVCTLRIQIPDQSGIQMAKNSHFFVQLTVTNEAWCIPGVATLFVIHKQFGGYRNRSLKAWRAKFNLRKTHNRASLTSKIPLITSNHI